MALISPLMPVTHVLQICTKTNQLLLVTHPRPAQNLSKFFDSFAIIGSQGLKVSKCMSMPILSSHFVMPSYAANEINTAINEYGYILCLKKCAILASCCFDKHGLIVIIFGKQHQHTFKNDAPVQFSMSLHFHLLYLKSQLQAAHTHSVLTAIFPGKPGLASCPLNFPSPFIPGLHILLGQA